MTRCNERQRLRLRVPVTPRIAAAHTLPFSGAPVRNHPPKSPRSALSHCRTAKSATRDSHHEPARAPGKSIEPGHAPHPPAFSPTKFLRRLRSAETLISLSWLACQGDEAAIGERPRKAPAETEGTAALKLCPTAAT